MKKNLRRLINIKLGRWSFFQSVDTYLNWMAHKIRNRTLVTYSGVIIKNSKFGTHVMLNNFVKVINCEIDSFTYLGAGCVFVNTKVGKFCSIAQDVKCGLGFHPIRSSISTHPAFYSINGNGISFVDDNLINENSQTVIGNDVLIGAGVIINDGVRIGDGSVIGAGAVVTKDIEPCSIVGGVPARLISYRFSPAERALLLSINWWNWPISKIKAKAKLFSSPDIFFNEIN